MSQSTQSQTPVCRKKHLGNKRSMSTSKTWHPAPGGILGDAPGYGKTATTIGLVDSSASEPRPEIPSDAQLRNSIVVIWGSKIPRDHRFWSLYLPKRGFFRFASFFWGYRANQHLIAGKEEEELGILFDVFKNWFIPKGGP